MRKVETKDEQIKRFAFDPNRDKVVDLPNYLDYPFFVTKADELKKTMKKYDLPAQILKIQHGRKK